MTYEKSLEWLFNQFPSYQKIGISAYKPDLDNILKLCHHFSVDYKKLKYIHIAGTNGKGSTSNYLASILQESNYQTGLFTSPHILDFRERIRVNGKMISKKKVISFCEKVKHSKSDIKPSFFEITWVLALIYFIEKKCDVCVIETGLGGRLDATNIISPILSIITNIGFDHTAILGNSLEKIAFEKAGIIKTKTPIIIGESNSITRKVFKEKAKLEQSDIYFAEEYKIKNPIFKENTYLFKNERTVKKAVEILNTLGFSLKANKIIKGIKNVSKNTGFIGRFQEISENPKTIVDAAHNVDGIKQLLKTLKHQNYKKLHVIYGASNDKNVLEILKLFPKNAQFYLCPFSNKRSLKMLEIEELKQKFSNNTQTFQSIKHAFQTAENNVKKNDLILITGSFFLLNDFFEYFPKKYLLKQNL